MCSLLWLEQTETKSINIRNEIVSVARNDNYDDTIASDFKKDTTYEINACVQFCDNVTQRQFEDYTILHKTCVRSRLVS